MHHHVNASEYQLTAFLLQDAEKRTPLHAAAFLGDAEITELLILSGKLWFLPAASSLCLLPFASLHFAECFLCFVLFPKGLVLKEPGNWMLFKILFYFLKIHNKLPVNYRTVMSYMMLHCLR